MTTPRRVERERVLELLYECELKSISAEDVLAELVVPPTAFVAKRVREVTAANAELDVILQTHATNWELDRVTVIDHLILRFAAWELLHDDTLDTPIIVSEAVELAKRFSTDSSGKFVNGVASAIAGAVREGLA